MPVNSFELLTAAKRIVPVANDEAHYRTLISRFYYSAYHSAIEFQDSLPSTGQNKANCGEHENLLHQLKHPTIPKEDNRYLESIELEHYLKKLLFQRRQADYKNDQTINARTIEINMAETENVFRITQP